MKFNKKSLARMAVLSSMLGIVGNNSIQGMEKPEMCSICQKDIIVDKVSTKCLHHFHKMCILQNIFVNGKCPECNEQLTENDLNDINCINFTKSDLDDQGFQSEEEKNEALKNFYKDNENQASYQAYLNRIESGEELDKDEFDEFIRLGELLNRHD